MPVGYAAVGGFDANTPTTPGHVFQITCAADCGSFTWANKTGNLPDIPVDSIIVNPNNAQQVFAGTDWGVYYTDDITVASPTWQRFENGIPHAMVWDMQIDRGVDDALGLDAQSRRIRFPSGRRRGDSNTNAYSYGYAYSYSNSDSYSHANGDGYTNSDGYSNGDTYFHAQTDTDAEASAHAEGSSNTSASPVVGGGSEK